MGVDEAWYDNPTCQVCYGLFGMFLGHLCGNADVSDGMARYQDSAILVDGSGLVEGQDSGVSV